MRSEQIEDEGDGDTAPQEMELGEDELADGDRHVLEARMKQRERTRHIPIIAGEESTPVRRAPRSIR